MWAGSRVQRVGKLHSTVRERKGHERKLSNKPKEKSLKDRVFSLHEVE